MLHNKKQVVMRSLAAGLAICAISTLIAYIWSRDTFLAEILVVFVAGVAFVAGSLLTLVIQLLFIKFSRKTAYSISALVTLTLVGLALWGYSF